MKLAFGKLNTRTGHEAGRYLLAKLYREETGKELPEILTGPYGKPYFADSPYCFSISHTPQYAFCVLEKHNVAIDAEELNRKFSPNFARRVLSPEELQRYEAAADQQRALLTFWVLKEACVKLSGKGLRGYPNTTDFYLDDGRVKELDGCLVAVMSECEGCDLTVERVSERLL